MTLTIWIRLGEHGAESGFWGSGAGAHRPLLGGGGGSGRGPRVPGASDRRGHPVRHLERRSPVSRLRPGRAHGVRRGLRHSGRHLALSPAGADPGALARGASRVAGRQSRPSFPRGRGSESHQRGPPSGRGLEERDRDHHRHARRRHRGRHRPRRLARTARHRRHHGYMGMDRRRGGHVFVDRRRRVAPSTETRSSVALVVVGRHRGGLFDHRLGAREHRVLGGRGVGGARPLLHRSGCRHGRDDRGPDRGRSARWDRNLRGRCHRGSGRDGYARRPRPRRRDRGSCAKNRLCTRDRRCRFLVAGPVTGRASAPSAASTGARSVGPLDARCSDSPVPARPQRGGDGRRRASSRSQRRAGSSGRACGDRRRFRRRHRGDRRRCGGRGRAPRAQSWIGSGGQNGSRDRVAAPGGGRRILRRRR